MITSAAVCPLSYIEFRKILSNIDFTVGFVVFLLFFVFLFFMMLLISTLYNTPNTAGFILNQTQLVSYSTKHSWFHTQPNKDVAYPIILVYSAISTISTMDKYRIGRPKLMNRPKLNQMDTLNIIGLYKFKQIPQQKFDIFLWRFFLW